MNLTVKKMKILVLLSKSETGMSFAELNKRKSFKDPSELNIILSELINLHWVYTVNETDNLFKITGVGEESLYKERVYRNSHVLTIATFCLSIASLIVSIVALGA